MRFYILDVFAEEKYVGNQLAVVMDCEKLTDEAGKICAKKSPFTKRNRLSGPLCRGSFSGNHLAD